MGGFCCFLNAGIKNPNPHPNKSLVKSLKILTATVIFVLVSIKTLGSMIGEKFRDPND